MLLLQTVKRLHGFVRLLGQPIPGANVQYMWEQRSRNAYTFKYSGSRLPPIVYDARISAAVTTNLCTSTLDGKHAERMCVCVWECLCVCVCIGECVLGV